MIGQGDEVRSASEALRARRPGDIVPSEALLCRCRSTCLKSLRPEPPLSLLLTFDDLPYVQETGKVEETDQAAIVDLGHASQIFGSTLVSTRSAPSISVS